MCKAITRLHSRKLKHQTGLDKSLNRLRDKRLLTFDQDKLSRVELIAEKNRTSSSAAIRINGRS